jgi:hypothetical protein
MSETDHLARRVSEKIEDGDIRGAIRLAASGDTLAAFNSDILLALREKHPNKTATSINHLSAAVTADDIKSTDSLTVESEDVAAAIKSFPNGSAGGLDGLRPQHLNEMISAQNGHHGERLIDILTIFYE